MLGFLKGLFGPPTDFKQLIKDGAIILDVRTKGEYNGGHIKGSINIPVDQLANHLNKFPNKSQTIITVCASGMRSGAAKGMLKSNGYASVFNGGSWFSLQQKIS